MLFIYWSPWVQVHLWPRLINLKSAFSFIPIHPKDWHLVSIYWQQQYYADLYFPFRLRLAPFLFNQLSDALEWVSKNNFGLQHVLHILDDFFIGEPSISNTYPALVKYFAFSCLSKHQSSPLKHWAPLKYLWSWVLSLIPLVWRPGFQRTSSDAPMIYSIPLLNATLCNWSNWNYLIIGTLQFNARR